MIEVFDTSLLWSLVDSEDENHKSALSWVKDKTVGELCILPTVTMEFRARYNLEFNKLIAAFILRMQKAKNSKFNLSEINRMIDQVSSDLVGQGSLDKKKMNRLRVNLHEYCRKAFRDSNRLTLKEMMSSVTSLKTRVEGISTGSIKILVEIGYVYPKIDGESIQKKVREILEKNIDFGGSGDSMIAGEMICLSSENHNSGYEFVTFDKDFAKLFSQAIDAMKLKNVALSLLNPSEAN